MSLGGRETAPVSRGVFARFDGQQRWSAGTPAVLRNRDPAWLEKWFPVPSRVPPRDGGRGAVWIRLVDGAWYVCHACVPAWSMDRSIPAWTVSHVDVATFDRLPLIAAESEAAEAASASDRAARAWPAERAEASVSEWTPSALPSLAALFDAASLAPPGSGASGHRLPAGMLDQGGWIALQAVLGAMRQAGVPAPGALLLGDAAWLEAVGHALAADAYVFLPGAAPARQPTELRARGVELSRFIGSLSDARSAVASAAAAGAASRRFVDALGAAVPLELVDPALIEPRECLAWAARVVDCHGTGDAVANLIDGLVARARGGEETVIAPALSLAAGWADAAGPASGVQARVDSWVGPLLRRT